MWVNVPSWFSIIQFFTMSLDIVETVVRLIIGMAPVPASSSVPFAKRIRK
jgi:hypothetical protein